MFYCCVEEMIFLSCVCSLAARSKTKVDFPLLIYSFKVCSFHAKSIDNLLDFLRFPDYKESRSVLFFSNF